MAFPSTPKPFCPLRLSASAAFLKWASQCWRDRAQGNSDKNWKLGGNHDKQCRIVHVWGSCNAYHCKTLWGLGHGFLDVLRKHQSDHRNLTGFLSLRNIFTTLFLDLLWDMLWGVQQMSLSPLVQPSDLAAPSGTFWPSPWRFQHDIPGIY